MKLFRRSPPPREDPTIAVPPPREDPIIAALRLLDHARISIQREGLLYSPQYVFISHALSYLEKQSEEAFRKSIGRDNECFGGAE
jgi:hypothetical protein